MTAPRVAARPPWTWACLACNETGTGSSSAHRCPLNRPDYLHGFWLDRLRWVIPIEQAKQLLQQPVARTELVRLLGERWSIEHDARAKAVTRG